MAPFDYTALLYIGLNVLSAIVSGFDLKTGKQLWQKSLGTLQKGSPVLADGKHVLIRDVARIELGACGHADLCGGSSAPSAGGS